MLPPGKKTELFNHLKSYKKKYINEKYIDLDESATRLMINDFLTNILGFAPLDEVKTEYMIKGTYADYVIQINGKRHIVVEVKAMNIELSDKHLRQVINYAANEGIDWALLTNGRHFQLYKVLFNKPIEHKLIFSIDFEDLKYCTECVQYLTKYSVLKNGLTYIWNRSSALDPENMAGLLYSPTIIALLRRELKLRYESTFEEVDIINTLNKIICTAHPNVKPAKFKTEKKTKPAKETKTVSTSEHIEAPIEENINEESSL